MDISLRKFYKTIIKIKKSPSEKQTLEIETEYRKLIPFPFLSNLELSPNENMEERNGNGGPAEKRTKENKKTIQCGNSHVH